MGRTLIFSPPAGPCDDDARLDDIVAHIHGADPAYWNVDAGHAAIMLDADSSLSPSLVIALAGSVGYYVELRADGVTRISDSDAGRTRMVKLWTGQSWYRVPADFCLAPEDCAAVAITFCTEGRADGRVNWIDKKTSGWQFGG
jgi:hypothetical protein